MSAVQSDGDIIGIRCLARREYISTSGRTPWRIRGEGREGERPRPASARHWHFEKVDSSGADGTHGIPRSKGFFVRSPSRKCFFSNRAITSHLTDDPDCAAAAANALPELVYTRRSGPDFPSRFQRPPDLSVAVYLLPFRYRTDVFLCLPTIRGISFKHSATFLAVFTLSSLSLTSSSSSFKVIRLNFVWKSSFSAIL